MKFINFRSLTFHKILFFSEKPPPCLYFSPIWIPSKTNLMRDSTRLCEVRRTLVCFLHHSSRSGKIDMFSIFFLQHVEIWSRPAAGKWVKITPSFLNPPLPVSHIAVKLTRVLTRLVTLISLLCISIIVGTFANYLLPPKT